MSADNNSRAERARATLRGRVEAKGKVFEESDSEVAELMADLLHLAVRIAGSEGAGRVLRVARMHFDAEHDGSWDGFE
ncbi:MAG TPA: hypothetical protein VD866_02400 [Urbifossiella sp.]|nr:hypothetical protein [Urbifossiella sp.]